MIIYLYVLTSLLRMLQIMTPPGLSCSRSCSRGVYVRCCPQNSRKTMSGSVWMQWRIEPMELSAAGKILEIIVIIWFISRLDKESIFSGTENIQHYLWAYISAYITHEELTDNSTNVRTRRTVAISTPLQLFSRWLSEFLKSKTQLHY